MSTKENKLAKELAEALNDTEPLQVYTQFVEKYSETFLRKIQAKVLAMPRHKIRRSRGGLFTFLIKQHEQNSSRN
jgi:hypothetical protein